MPRPQLQRLQILLVATIALCTGSTAARADEKSLDNFLQQAWKDQQVQPAAKCSDEVFGRRIYLDLVGRIPSTTELAAFKADGRDDRRLQLIDVLLASEDYVQHFADIFDTLLMGRTTDRNYDERHKHEWRSYLERVFRDNRRWDDVVSEILLARPATNNDRGAVWFLFERNNKHQEIAEAVAPAFFGIHIECAQCHDHMIATEIEQAHYWGLVAFFNRSNNQHTKNGPRVSESAIGGFSEFAGLAGDSHPNRLTFFNAKTIEEARPEKEDKQNDSDELYIKASLDGDPRVPKFSRREKFVHEIVNNHPLVAKAFVNRIWAMLMGRGIVHPFDKIDSTHPPSHPELLDELTADFEASEFNIRRLVRRIISNSAYGLSSVRPDGVEEPSTFAWYLERPLTAEQFARSAQLAVRGTFNNDAAIVKQVRQQLKDVMPEEQVTTIKEALFLTNNEALNSFINNSNDDDHLVPQLLKLPTDAKRAAELVRTIFGREVTSEEREALVQHMTKSESNLKTQLQQIVWSMLTSAEFRFNH